MNQPPEPSKAAKRQLRELAALAYERELAHELGSLERAFQGWRQGRIDAFELTNLIHRFHNGPARQLYDRYERGDRRLVVAGAVVTGIIDEAEVPEALRPYLGPAVAAISSLQDE